jgi:hypothetical protein
MLPACVLWGLACSGTVEVEPQPEVANEVPVAVDTGSATPDEPTSGSPDPARRNEPRAPLEAPPPGADDPPEQGEPPPAVEPGEDEEDGKGAKREPGEAPRGITKVSDDRWQLTTRLADSYKDDPYQLANAVEKVGEGWKIKGVRQKDAYHLGLRGSDVVFEVNGHKLKTQAQLLTAYATLRNKKAYEVLIERNGKLKTLHYDIVE